MTFRKTKEVRAYALFLFHRMINKGNIAHERWKNKDLIPFLEKERALLHNEAIKSIGATRYGKRGKKERLELEVFVNTSVPKKVKKYYAQKRKSKRKGLPKGYCRCGLCMKTMLVTKWREHSRKSYEHQVLQRVVVRLHYPGFYKILNDKMKLQQIERSIKILQKMKNEIIGLKGG